MTLVHKKTSAEIAQSKIDETVITKDNADLNEKLACERKKQKMPHKCSICGNSYKTNALLKRHIDTVHEGKKPHKCSICDKTFSRKDPLKRHVDSVHGGKNPTTTKENV